MLLQLLLDFLNLISTFHLRESPANACSLAVRQESETDSRELVLAQVLYLDYFVCAYILHQFPHSV